MPLPVLDVPSYNTQLPSSKKSVKYRPFLVKEHKILLMLKDADGSDMVRIIQDIIDNCTFKKLNISELAFFDLVHLFVELRKVSLGEVLDLLIKCECGADVPAQANLNDTQIIFNEKHSTRIFLNRDIAVDFRYPDLEESMTIYQTNNQDLIIDKLVDCIVGIHQDNEFYDARESSHQELRTFIENLNIQQFNELTEFFNSMPRIRLDVQSTCSACNKKHQNSIEGLDNFFV